MLLLWVGRCGANLLVCFDHRRLCWGKNGQAFFHRLACSNGYLHFRANQQGAFQAFSIRMTKPNQSLWRFFGLLVDIKFVTWCANNGHYNWLTEHIFEDRRVSYSMPRKITQSG